MLIDCSFSSFADIYENPQKANRLKDISNPDETIHHEVTRCSPHIQSVRIAIIQMFIEKNYISDVSKAQSQQIDEIIHRHAVSFVQTILTTQKDKFLTLYFKDNRNEVEETTYQNFLETDKQTLKLLQDIGTYLNIQGT